MDRFVNSNIEKQTIYDIYRACRLCGAGGGYKMPIIQNIIDLDGVDIELKQKIKACVQIEVHADDKMPPLICELCVDKVNDFYEFLEMCRQTNNRTRLRLGLPPQILPRGTLDADNCILGVTEPLYVNDDDKPLSKHRGSKSKKKPIENEKKKVPEVKIKVENTTPSRSSSISSKSSRTSRSSRQNTPSRASRFSTQQIKVEVKTEPQKKPQTKPKPQHKSISRKEVKTAELSSLLKPRTIKRQREREPSKPVVPAKKVKISIKPIVKPPSSPTTFRCLICSNKPAFKAPQALFSHLRWIHTVSYTSNKLACNACGEWFVTTDEAKAHHKRHQAKYKPYHCTRCITDFWQQHAYDEHFEENQCVPWTENPDVQCATCWKYFPTINLKRKHKCAGRGNRPGGKCSKCDRSYTTIKYLKKHETYCSGNKKVETAVDPGLRGRLRPMQVRVAKCDPLLSKVKQEHYDVSSVTQEFGLDKNFVYPYISSVGSVHVKTEPTDDLDTMVNIKQEIKDEFFCEEEFIHWDSSDSSDSDHDSNDYNKKEHLTPNLVVNPFARKKRVHSLSTLSLKTIFSQKFLGKVPRKQRKFKMEKLEKNAEFDSTMNDLNDSNMTNDINNIINNLGNRDSAIGRNNDGAEARTDLDTLFGNKEDSSTKIHETGPLQDERSNEISEIDEKSSDFSEIENQGSPQIDYIDTLLQNTNEELQTTVDDNCDNQKTDERDENKSDDQKSGEITKSVQENDSEKDIDDYEKKSIEDDALTKINALLNDVQTNNISDNSQDTAMSDDNTEIDAIDALLQNDPEKPIQQNENVIQNGKSGIIDDLLQVHDKDCTENLEDSDQINDLTDNADTENTTLEKCQATNNAVDENFEENENSESNLQKVAPEEMKLDNSDSSINNSECETNNGISDLGSSDKNDNFRANENVNYSLSVRAFENNQNTSIDNKHDKYLTVSDSLESSGKSKGVSTNEIVIETDETLKTNGVSIEGLEEVSDTEMDDEKLMEELDQQIGESDKNFVNNLVNDDVKIHDNVREKDKITLEDLLPHEKSMDLDSISDEEFDFEA